MMTLTSEHEHPRVVILGGGFGGHAAARALRHAPVSVTLIDRNNHQAFQPLLYQVATAGLEASDVGLPLRSMVRRQKNIEVVMAEASAIDAASRMVHLANGATIGYEYLIVATGSEPSYFGHADWERLAPGLKTIRDALEIRHRVLTAFERAEQELDPETQRAYLRFVIIGGGPTGVELAGAVAELARHALRRDFRRIDTTRAKVILIEASPSILAAYPPSLQRKAREQLESLGVEIHTGMPVRGLDESGVNAGDLRIAARTVLWAAGVRATSVAHSLGTAVDDHGRIEVTPTLNPAGLPDVFVIGDLVALEQNGSPLPGLAAPAMQAGRYAARAIQRRLRGKAVEPFRYRNKGQLATIGRSRAVGLFPGGIEISGFVAWLLYLSVHLFYLAGFRKRLRVFLTWAWSYVTYGRGARLISSATLETASPVTPPQADSATGGRTRPTLTSAWSPRRV
jgi:NADH dehydrogenase